MIILDVETTTFDEKTGSIIEIGAIDFENPFNQFYQQCQIMPQRSYLYVCLKYNGNTISSITNPQRPPLSTTINNFNKWAESIQDKTIAGINPDFDMKFLKEAYQHTKLKFPFKHRKVDLHSLIYAHHLANQTRIPLKATYSNINSDCQLKYVGLPPEPKPHKAINGAKYECEAFYRIIHKKPYLQELKEYLLPTHLQK